MSDKAKVITIGGSGLVGQRISELLKDRLHFKNFSRANGVDIVDPTSLKVIEEDAEYPFVLLLAAKTDVDGCEKDRELGNNGEAWKINVAGVENVANICLRNNKKLILISTDFVFSGDDTPDGGYSEEDKPDPVNWYGTTKYEGELKLQNSGARHIIIRTAYPYKKTSGVKKDFVNIISERLRSGQPVAAVTDHVMTPTFVDDLAVGIATVIERDSEGIFHIVGGSSLSPFEASVAIAKKIQADESLITKTSRAEFFKDRAVRPFNLSIKNDKIGELGVSMKGFQEGIEKALA